MSKHTLADMNLMNPSLRGTVAGEQRAEKIRRQLEEWDATSKGDPMAETRLEVTALGEPDRHGQHHLFAVGEFRIPIQNGDREKVGVNGITAAELLEVAFRSVIGKRGERQAKAAIIMALRHLGRAV